MLFLIHISDIVQCFHTLLDSTTTTTTYLSPHIYCTLNYQYVSLICNPLTYPMIYPLAIYKQLIAGSIDTYLPLLVLTYRTLTSLYRTL